MKLLRKCTAVILTLGIMLTQGVQVQASTTMQIPSGFENIKVARAVRECEVNQWDDSSGMMVSVFTKDETIYSDYVGYADKEAQIAVDENTVMEWGSVTKLLVWVSVMQLWEQGQIDLETDIREYLPEGFLTNLKYDEPITMLNLMNHTAGFQEVPIFYAETQDEILTLGETLKSHAPEQIYKPGTVTSYSNWGSALAGYVVECISGERFDSYVHKHIFEPLGMEHSALAADLSDNPWVQEQRKELQGYTTKGELIPDAHCNLILYPSGACTSNLADLETFGKALLDEESPLFQNTETWNTLFTPTAYFGDSNVPSNYHGFWSDACGIDLIGHAGNTRGCSAHLVLDLQNIVGAVVMTNQHEEEIYNFEMMSSIFGGWSGKIHYDGKLSEIDGLYRMARTIRTGPFKLYSLPFVSSSEALNQHGAKGIDSDTGNICCASNDYVKVPTWVIVLEVTLVVLWGIALFFAVVSLFVKGIKKIVSICKRETIATPLGTWSTLSAILQVVAAVLLVVMMSQAFEYMWTNLYIWIPVTFRVIMLLMFGLAVYGMVMLRKTEATLMRRIYNGMTAVLLVIGAINIAYWNLFMWWKI